MLHSSLSLLSELSALQQAGALTDTLLVGERHSAKAHWAVLARWEFWRGLRGEGETGPVTIILPGVGREELERMVHQAYGEAREDSLVGDEMSQDADIDIYDHESEQDDLVEFKLETDYIDDYKDDLDMDGLTDEEIDENIPKENFTKLSDEEDEEEIEGETIAIEEFTKDLPDFIVCDREAILKSFSYIQSTNTGEKHKSGPWAGRQKYHHECGFVDSEGEKCGFKKGVGVKYLMRHTQSHVQDIYWCTLCEKSIKRSIPHLKSKHTDRSLEKPLEARLQESDYKCTKCDRKFLLQRSLDYHLNMVHKNIRNFPCSLCDYKGKTKRQINNHNRVKHLKTDLWPCHVCGKVLAERSFLEDHLLLHGEATLSCEICGAKYKTEVALNSHRRNTHLEKKIICEYCSKPFAIKSTHDRHVVANHTKTRNFACKTCDFKCTTKPNLRRHEFIHSEDKPFDCKECEKRFRVKEALTRHKLVHTGKKPYGCGQCPFRCQQSYDLTKHYKKIHDMIVKNPKDILQSSLQI